MSSFAGSSGRLTGQSAGKGNPAGQARGVAKALLAATSALNAASASSPVPDEAQMGRCAMSCQAAVAAAALLLPKRITITIAATTVDVIDDQVLGNLAMRVDFSKPEQYDVRTEIGQVACLALVSAIPWTPLESVEALSPLVAGHLHNKAITITPLLEAFGRLLALDGAAGDADGSAGGGGTTSTLSSSVRAAHVNAVVGLVNNCAALPAMSEGEPEGMRQKLATAVDAAWAKRLHQALKADGMLPAMHEPCIPLPRGSPREATGDRGGEGDVEGETESAAEVATSTKPEGSGEGASSKKSKKSKKKKGKRTGGGDSGSGSGSGSGGGGMGGDGDTDGDDNSERLGRQMALGKVNGTGEVDLLANLGLLLYTLSESLQVAKQLKFVERSKASTDAISLYLMTHDLWARLPLGLPTKDLTTTTSHFSFTKADQILKVMLPNNWQHDDANATAFNVTNGRAEALAANDAQVVYAQTGHSSINDLGDALKAKTDFENIEELEDVANIVAGIDAIDCAGVAPDGSKVADVSRFASLTSTSVNASSSPLSAPIECDAREADKEEAQRAIEAQAKLEEDTREADAAAAELMAELDAEARDKKKGKNKGKRGKR